MNARKLAHAIRLQAEALRLQAEALEEDGNDPEIPDGSKAPPKRKIRRVRTFPPPPPGMVVPTELERMRARKALARQG